MTNEPQKTNDPKTATGHYVLSGAKAIGVYMGVSPATISRWRKRFRGRTEIRLCFPAFNVPTGVGRGWRLMTNTELITQWMERWVELDGVEIRRRRPFRRVRKKQGLGVIGEIPRSAGESATPIREGPRSGRVHGCTCGTSTRCTAHEAM